MFPPYRIWERSMTSMCRTLKPLLSANEPFTRFSLRSTNGGAFPPYTLSTLF